MVSALSTLDTWLETLLLRSTEIALADEAELVTGPATRLAALWLANCAATASRTWFAGSPGPSAGAVCGVTMTARVARFQGAPLVVR